MDLPKISFLTPVFNEARQMEPFLRNIRDQDYPQDKIEIVIADGGSTDNTVAIASRFGCRIISNPEKLAEPGLVRCEDSATGDLFVIMAADNRLPRKDWLKLMVRPFLEDPEVWGAYTHIVPSADDNLFNRYYSLLHVEPFSWFVYGNYCNPRRFRFCYQTAELHTGYEIYSFTLKNHPLIAFAQGFVLRRDFRRESKNKGDDILPFIQLIEDGHKIAYVPQAGIQHLHLQGYINYLKKYQSRIRNNLYKKNIGFDSRRAYLSFSRKTKKYLWLIYGSTVVGPLFHSLIWYLRDKEKCWFWHMPASVGLTYLMIYEVIRKQYLYLINIFLGFEKG